MFNKLKQFKNIRDKAKTLQSSLSQITAEGGAGWGKVKITIDGNQKILSVFIDQGAMGDKTKLEEMIREATNDAITKIQSVMSKKLKEMGGLDIAKDLQDMMGN